ncbi:MAG: agmatinase [Desulfomonile tiedjei]|nr:agmatinase [Desulfomonile tiedjei]
MVLDRFLGCSSREILPHRPVILGCPLDVTSTYRRGSAEAPDEIRAASDSLETYSPLLDADLDDLPFADIGNVPLDSTSLESALTIVRVEVSRILKHRGKPFCIGGEHTITLPAVEALRSQSDDFVVLHLDAHSDLRDEYEGKILNHATVIRRVAELIGPARLIQMGVRAGTRDEFAWMREHGTAAQWGSGFDKTLLKRIAGRAVYLSLDLDVLDPAGFPGTGNPEPGGWSYEAMELFLLTLTRVNLIAADVVELNPGLDASQVSTITAAKIVRELLVILGRR